MLVVASHLYRFTLKLAIELLVLDPVIWVQVVAVGINQDLYILGQDNHDTVYTSANLHSKQLNHRRIKCELGCYLCFLEVVHKHSIVVRQEEGCSHHAEG